jgi:hypothetical protein
MGEAMNLPIQGVPGFTGNNIVNAAFATHGLKSIMDGSVTKPWKEAYKSGNPWDYANAVSENAMTVLELAPLVGPGYRGALEANKIYNNIATGNSIIPYAWKSPAVGLSQNASDAMFKGLLNSNKLTDAERALIVEYQYDSKPFTGRGILPVNQEKKEALNNIIKKYNLNINNNSIFTRRFNPENQSLGADFVNNNLNLKDRPTSFSAGVGVPFYGSGAVDRLVIPNRYAKNMGNNFLANEYEALSDNAINLVDPKVKNWASDIGINNNNVNSSMLNSEREVIGTGLNFKRIGKVKNDIGGYDHIVKPINKKIITPQNTIVKVPKNEENVKSFTDMLGEMFFEPEEKKSFGKMVTDQIETENFVRDYNKNFKKRYKDYSDFKKEYTDFYNEQVNVFGRNPEEVDPKGIMKDLNDPNYLNEILGFNILPNARKNIARGLTGDYKGAYYNAQLDNGGRQLLPERGEGIFKLSADNFDKYEQVKPWEVLDKNYFIRQNKYGGPIVTNRGQWDYPGQTTIIPSNKITMKGVPYPVLGVDNTGYTQMMQPQMNYTFPGQYVTEYPIMQYGGQNNDWEIIE